MARTTSDLVKGLLLRDYDADRAPSLSPFIDTASLLIDEVVECAADSDVTISTAKAEMLERWMAAHFYTKSDPTYSSRSTNGASGSFVRNPDCPEPYKDGALSLDSTGCLEALLKGARAGGFWMGKALPDQRTYEERN